MESFCIVMLKDFCLCFTYLPRSPPWTDFHKILHRCRSRGRVKIFFSNRLGDIDFVGGVENG